MNERHQAWWRHSCEWTFAVQFIRRWLANAVQLGFGLLVSLTVSLVFSLSHMLYSGRFLEFLAQEPLVWIEWSGGSVSGLWKLARPSKNTWSSRRSTAVCIPFTYSPRIFRFRYLSLTLLVQTLLRSQAFTFSLLLSLASFRTWTLE